MTASLRIARAAPRAPVVGWWLLALCGLTLAMIVVGGLTRLTDSGLSITEWRLDKGLTPPLTDARWAEEFALYRQTTEYQVQNRGMSLAEFQAIYWWEWGHRFLGKVVGVVFIAPFLLFWRVGGLEGRFWPVLGLGVLGGVQGAIGWWMVQSGLADRLDVSPLRLATHLGVAFLILGLSFHLALGAFGWPRGASRLGLPTGAAWLLVAALFGQVILGALMAGVDAGAAYPDWPTIGGRWIPEEVLAGDLTAHATLQFYHRTAGYLVAALALAIAAGGALSGRGPARGIALAIGALALVQAGLGIAAVMTGAHLHVSLTHQIGAACLWLAAIALVRAAMIR
ncbi:MAG: heme A synthase [Alphaproteobacteria bacterium]|nr:heme A synthase [Alphaproteobacteria bacterium]